MFNRLDTVGKEHTTVEQIAENEYTIRRTGEEFEGDIISIRFQNGPILELGVNGCMVEDLIEICIDRIDWFQRGEFPVHYNNLAMKDLKSALGNLTDRTKNREERRVEGTYQP